jgi:hypothetical protein
MLTNFPHEFTKEAFLNAHLPPPKEHKKAPLFGGASNRPRLVPYMPETGIKAV